jgi:hypothetical protein
MSWELTDSSSRSPKISSHMLLLLLLLLSPGARTRILL